jgi:hypothetical protein
LRFFAPVDGVTAWTGPGLTGSVAAIELSGNVCAKTPRRMALTKTIFLGFDDFFDIGIFLSCSRETQTFTDSKSAEYQQHLII